MTEEEEDDSLCSKVMETTDPAAVEEDDYSLDTGSPPTLHLRSENFPTDVYHTEDNESDVLKAKGYTLDMSKPIGSGKAAKVYRGTRRSFAHSKVAHKVACKVIELRKNKKKKLQELVHELYVLETVSHDNIVKLFEHFIIHANVYIFMELAEGGTLGEYVGSEGPLGEKVSRRLFRQMCEAVHHMHKMKISHRDLKLANVLLDETQRVCKVADFGMSRVLFTEKEGVKLCRSFCGTVLYMAPEIVRIKKAKATNSPVVPFNPYRADIWALGVCLYVMVNKAYPFNDEKPGMLKDMVDRKWRIVKKVKNTISPELKALLGNLLEPDAAKRIDFYGISNHSWMTSSTSKKT